MIKKKRLGTNEIYMTGKYTLVTKTISVTPLLISRTKNSNDELPSPRTDMKIYTNREMVNFETVTLLVLDVSYMVQSKNFGRTCIFS